MEFNRKKLLIQNLIDEISNMAYQEDSATLSSFLSTGEVILAKIFGENSKHIEKFKNVSFYPIFYSFDGDNTASEISSFQSGKSSMISVLKGALTDIELDEELHTATHDSDNKSEHSKQPIRNNKVFLVHGHDDGLKSEVARFVEKIGFEAVILHEQANAGNTIIEKIERNSDVGFAIVLYTPCDEGKAKSSEQLRNRARQNVVFEHGFFIAKLGRANVVALHKGEDLELPNDISGVVYVKYESGAWKYEIAKEMVSSGYKVDFMKI